MITFLIWYYDIYRSQIQTLRGLHWSFLRWSSPVTLGIPQQDKLFLPFFFPKLCLRFYMKIAVQEGIWQLPRHTSHGFLLPWKGMEIPSELRKREGNPACGHNSWQSWDFLFFNHMENRIAGATEACAIDCPEAETPRQMILQHFPIHVLVIHPLEKSPPIQQNHFRDKPFFDKCRENMNLRSWGCFILTPSTIQI